jgi:hypothetical protein
MAAVHITNTTKATHGSTPTQVEGLLDVSDEFQFVEKVFRGDGAPEEFDQVDGSLSLSLNFNSMAAAHAFAAGAESNLVVRERKQGGNLRDVTIKNVKATRVGRRVPALQDTATGTVAVSARAKLGASDTYATMVTMADVTP